ncbi:hypothetical protein OPQ81_006206 [Rhizoctonia solani]|nr:hypothetical protein OPQ81_006206 [Rhizoctonia solani]
MTPTRTPVVPVTTNERVPRPGGVVLGMLIASCVLMAVLFLGGMGWVVAMRGYFKQSQYPVAQPHKSPEARTQDSKSRSIPPTSNHISSITSTRRRVRTADHGTPSPLTALQLSELTRDSTSPSERKRAATLLQTIHIRAIRGSPKIGFGGNKASPSLDSSSTMARKAFSPQLDLGQFSPRFGSGQFSPTLEIEDRRKKEGSLAIVIDESPGLMNSWSSALRLDRLHSPGRADSVDSLRRETDLVDSFGEHRCPDSPTPNKVLCTGGNKTMSMSELFRSEATIDATVDSSGVSPDRYDHDGNLGFMNNSLSTPTGSGGQVTPQPQPILNRAESYAERTNQLSMALLSPPISMHAKPVNEALGISFDSFFSPATERPPQEPRYGAVSSERIVRMGHSQETLTTAYVTASEPSASPLGGRPKHDSSSAGHGIPVHIGGIESPSSLHSQVAELDDIASPSLTTADLEVMGQAESSNRTLSAGNLNQSLSVEYGPTDHSIRALDSFPAMLRGSLSCFPEDVSINTPILPSTGSSRYELTHRESSDIMLLPADDLTQGCLVLTRVGDDSSEQEKSVTSSENMGGVSFIVCQEASNLVVRSEEDSILSPDLSEHATEHTDSIVSREQDNNMRSSVDSIMVSH